MKDAKMVEAGRKAWETRRRREQEAIEKYKIPEPPALVVPYDEDMTLTAPLISEDLPWVEKHRPITLNDVIGNAVGYLKAFVKTGSMPLAMVFHGDYGTGKTASAKALVRDYFVFRGVFNRSATFKEIRLGRNLCPDYEGCFPPVLYVDATITGDIETIRTRVLMFMRCISIRGFPKFAIFDEADRLGFSAQGALRSLLEKYPNTKTIYTTNRLDSVDDAIVSRAAGGVFEFKKPSVKEIADYLKRILQKEALTLEPSKLEEIAVGVKSVREAVGRLQQEAIVIKAGVENG